MVLAIPLLKTDVTSIAEVIVGSLNALGLTFDTNAGEGDFTACTVVANKVGNRDMSPPLQAWREKPRFELEKIIFSRSKSFAFGQ